MRMANVLIVCLVTRVASHGIFWSPTSRAQLAQLSGWESDATKIIAEPMPEVAHGREYPGGRPWAEPGKSVSNVGPCGMKSYGQKTNWNHPEHGWGPVQATFNAGEVIDISWCVSNHADHGGLYSYRMCSDPNITAKFIDGAYTPNEGDMAEMEDCFQKGILACTDVPGQKCPVHPDCKDGWGCMQSRAWFNCGPKDGGRCRSRGNETCTTHEGPGTILRDQVKLPNLVSNHTLIGFRWDCQDTPQLWLHCADVTLL